MAPHAFSAPQAVAIEPSGALARQSLSQEVMRLLHGQCLSCHNAEKHKGGLLLSSRELLLKGGDSGLVFLESNPPASLLLKVLEPDADPHMPPKKQLSAQQLGIMKDWLVAGAPWDAEFLAKTAAPRDPKLGAVPASFRPALAIALSPDAKRLAVGRGRELTIYDLASTNFPAVASAKAHADLVRALAWSPNGELLASGGYRELKVWKSADLTPAWSASKSLLGQVTALRFTPHGGALAVADSAPAESGWVRLHDSENGSELAAWAAHSDAIYDLATTPDGGLLASAAGDKLVRSWELVSRKVVGEIEAHAGAVLGGAVHPDGSEIATIGADKQLKLWDLKTRQSVVAITGRRHNFTAAAWSGDGKALVAADEDGRLARFSDFKRHTGEQSSETAKERQLGQWAGPLHAVAVSFDASRAAAAAQDGSVYLVDGEGKLLQKFEPEALAAESAAASSSTNSPSFVRDVLPLLAKAGCMAGSCHAKPEGQSGFKLSVFSFDPKSDYRAITQEYRGRRVFPVAPEESLLLLKPTMAIDHGGGQRIEPGTEIYQTLVAWIRGGMAYQHPVEPVLARISVEPRDGIFQKNSSHPLRVKAHYSDGAERDVTRLADFVSNDKELARAGEDGTVRIGTVEGESVVVARFMGFVDACRITVPAEKVLPAEKYAALPEHNFIDRIAHQQFRKLGFFPSELSSDAEFLRRSSLDVTGVLPTPAEVRQFLADSSSGKRRAWIEHLLQHPAWADYWANKWTDLIRSNPDRVGVKSIFFLDQWVREAFRANKPYDYFVREIVMAEGSNHQNGPLSLYRDRREPQDLATIVSQLFLGVRMECAKCHHHPNEKWSQDDFYQLAAFFGPVKQKGAGLSPPISAGTETFYFAAGGGVRHPVTDAVMKPRPLDSPELKLEEAADPRAALADWMTDPSNPYFAKAAVNRVWAALFGRGFVDPVDDFRISNPAANEPLLNALAEDFTSHGYDLKHLMRAILNSRLYQLSSAPNDSNLHDTKNFSRSYRRRLPAEVLLDAVNDVTGTEDKFNGCPPGTRAIQTWSYKVRSQFMDAFGRPNPSTDCPCERDARSSVVQSLHMMNSRGLQAKLSDPNGRVKQLADSPRAPGEIVTELYLAALNRFPTAAELEKAAASFPAPQPEPAPEPAAGTGTQKDAKADTRAARQAAVEDVLWALLNSPEFVFNH